MAENHVIAQILITFGGLFLLGLIADLVGRHTPLPRVTLLLLAGFAIGPSVLDWLPAFTERWFPVLTNIALSMVGFLLGQKMTRLNFSRLGRSVLLISLGAVAVTALVVFGGLYVSGVGLEAALLLAAIATATAPAATVDVVREYEAKGKFTDALLGIVAIDDTWGLIVFSFAMVVVQSLSGDGGAVQCLTDGMREVGGGLLLGVLLGFPMAFLTGRIRPGEATQAEALGMVMLCAGLAVWLEVSYLLSALVMGVVVANFARHCERPFHALERVEWPFLILFFLLAGAALQVQSLLQVGSIGLAYILLRSIGRIAGGGLTCQLIGADERMTRWIGIALMPQAGVAIGMVLLAAQRLPELKDTLLPVVLAATVFFELVGPILSRFALLKAGDISPHNKGFRSG